MARPKAKRTPSASAKPKAPPRNVVPDKPGPKPEAAPKPKPKPAAKPKVAPKAKPRAAAKPTGPTCSSGCGHWSRTTAAFGDCDHLGHETSAGDVCDEHPGVG